MNYENKYQTKDLAEAGVLLVMKRSLIDIKREGNVCWFIFDDKKRCEELSKQFFFDKLFVDARTYFEAISRLKNRIFSKD